jgi:hypothetical protein
MKRTLIVWVFLILFSVIFTGSVYAAGKASLSVEILRTLVNAITGTATADIEFETPLSDNLTFDFGMIYFSAPSAGSYFQPSIGVNLYITARSLSGFWVGVKYAPMMSFGPAFNYANALMTSMGFKLILDNVDGIFLEPSFALNWQLEQKTGQQVFPLFMFRVGYIF